MTSLLDILNEETWTQKATARDKHNEPVHVMSPEACKFCLLGAIIRMHGNIEMPATSVVRVIGDLLGRQSFVSWNDAPGRTFEEVRSVILKAEAMLEAAPKEQP